MTNLELDQELTQDLDEIAKEENRKNPEDEIEPTDVLEDMIERYWAEQEVG